jgi:hypothetical protein
MAWACGYSALSFTVCSAHSPRFGRCKFFAVAGLDDRSYNTIRAHHATTTACHHSTNMLRLASADVPLHATMTVADVSRQCADGCPSCREQLTGADRVMLASTQAMACRPQSRRLCCWLRGETPVAMARPSLTVPWRCHPDAGVPSQAATSGAAQRRRTRHPCYPGQASHQRAVTGQ